MTPYISKVERSYDLGYKEGVEDTLKKVEEILDKRIEYVGIPMTEMNRALMFFLIDIKKEISTEKGK